MSAQDYVARILSVTDVTSSVGVVAATVTTVIAATFSSLAFRRQGVDPKRALTIANVTTRIQSEIENAKPGAPIPFEIEQLAAYYSLTLGQARVSFWFSLVFASLGFMVIVGGATLYTKEGGMTPAVLKITSGLVVDAVSALFFVQSRQAQQAMSAFFEKLRSDRQSVEARNICAELSDSAIRDQLKTILVIQYSSLDPKPLLDALAIRVSGAGSAILPQSTTAGPAQSS